MSTKSDGIMKKVLKGGESQYYMHVMGGRGDFNKVVRHSSKEVKKWANFWILFANLKDLSKL